MLLLPNIDPLVDPGEAVEAIRRGYLTEAKFLPRQALTVGDVWFAPMVAHMGGKIAVKLVGIYPRARPTVKAVVMVIDPERGSPLALINGTQLTGWRTAAASAVAARAMGAEPETIGIIGAGLQAEYHLRVFKALYPSASFKVYDIEPTRAAQLAAKYGAVSVTHAEALGSDLVIAATTSKSPVVLGATLKAGALWTTPMPPRRATTWRPSGSTWATSSEARVATSAKLRCTSLWGIPSLTRPWPFTSLKRRRGQGSG